MKRSIFITALFALFISSASHSVPRDSACHDGDPSCCHINYKGYGGFSMKSGPFSNGNYFTVGWNGAFILVPHFALGGGGYSSMYAFPYYYSSDQNADDRGINWGYGGLMPEFFFFSDKRIGLFVNAILGAGGYSVENDGGGFAVAEPHGCISFRIAEHFRTDLGLAYRFIPFGHSPVIPLSEFEGPSVFVQFRFGIFH